MFVSKVKWDLQEKMAAFLYWQRKDKMGNQAFLVRKVYQAHRVSKYF